MSSADLATKKARRCAYFRQWYEKNRKKPYIIPPGMKEVGVSKIKENGKVYVMLYRHCPQDAEGWVDNQKFKPLQHDLCDLRSATGKIMRGWWEGTSWGGLRIAPCIKVTHWRRSDWTM